MTGSQDNLDVAAQTSHPPAPLAESHWVAWVCWIMLGAALVAFVEWRLAVFRENILSQDPVAAKANWQQWREEAAKHDGIQHPVKRKPINSEDPPGIILFRDHYLTLAIASAFATAAPYAFLVFVLRGMFLRR